MTSIIAVHSRRSLTPLGILAVVSLLISAVGCGRSGLVRVSGRVAYADGSPVPLGRVVIESPGGSRGAWGRIKSDGRFTMGTRTENDGVAPGTYRVAILDALTASGPEGPGKEFVDARFGGFETSGIEFRVPEQTDWQILVEPPTTSQKAPR
jgi:hypothetical protein